MPNANISINQRSANMEQIRISAKNLGELTLPTFCPRCFWIKRHAARLPFQIFPGIFSSIDSYSKKITTVHFERYQKLVQWFIELGLSGEPVKVPHHTKYKVLDTTTEVLLTGVPDEIIRLSDGAYSILDYKTAKFTGTQDELLPMYEIQLNAYAYIGERLEFNPVKHLFLVYYEPVTEVTPEQIDALVLGNGFRLVFSEKTLPISVKTDVIPPLLEKVREIYDLPQAPNGKDGCKDCQAIDSIVEMLS